MIQNNKTSPQHACVYLKKDREKAIKNRHHWIFSGAVKQMPDFKNGGILPVYSHDNELLGSAYFNKNTSIAGRMLSFGNMPPLKAIEDSIKNAIALRKKLFDKSLCNCYRLVNGEGDLLPGLIVDVYNTVLVIQISTLGMEKLKSFVMELLVKYIQPQCVYEKSIVPSRREEDLKDVEGILYGALPEPLEVVENGLRFYVDLQNGQKTGFFIDQREMRKLVSAFSRGRHVLDCFSYTGGFSVYAASGGAVSVDMVDTSETSMELAKKNCSLNGLRNTEFHFYVDDVFKFLRTNELKYDFIILDPPAFAKRKADVIQACRGYKDINRLAIQKILPRSYLLTCSCSHHVDEVLFQKVVFEAAMEAKRNVRIIQKHHQGYDHPVNIYHPEGSYLKSLFLYVD